MNCVDYTPLAMRTASPSAGDHGVSTDLVHAVLGLCDEARELLDAKGQDNVIEELGDLLWFCALVGQATSTDLFVVYAEDKGKYDGHTPFDIAHSALGLAGLIKKPYAYGKAMPKAAIHSEVLNIISAVEALAQRLNMTLGEVMELNLLKLKMRFPERFSCAAAIKRNVGNEAALFLHWQTLLPILRTAAVWFLCREGELEEAKSYLGTYYAGSSATKYLRPDSERQPGYWLAYATPDVKEA